MNDEERHSRHESPGDDELARWREQWRGEAPAPRLDLDDIRRRARRRDLGLLLYLAGCVLVAVVGTGVMFWVAAESGKAVDFGVAAGLTLLVVWALVFELNSLRGLWRPSAETPAAFLDLAIARTRRWLKVVRFSWWLMALEVLLFVPWLLVRFEERQADLGDRLLGFGFLAVMVGMVAVGVVLLRRWALRRLETLLALRRSLEEA